MCVFVCVSFEGLLWGRSKTYWLNTINETQFAHSFQSWVLFTPPASLAQEKLSI